MKKSNICLKSLLFLIIIAVLIPVHSSGQKGAGKRTGRTASKTQKTKITYKNYVWIEGENAVATNFAKEKTYNFFCSDRHALQLSKDADPKSDKGYYASYVFYVPGTKRYDFWMGCTPPGSIHSDKPGYASPFEWKIDDGDFVKASSENTFVKEYYAPGSYYWTKITSGSLTEGKHTLTIRINQKRSSGWDYYFYIDSIVFIPKFSDYLIPLMDFPETSPSDFSDQGKGIKFSSVEYYKKLIKKNPGDRKSIFTLLQLYTWLYEYDKSIDLCRTYLKRKPRDIEMRLLLASSLAWSDKLNEAIREYNNIISIDKKNITARKLLAVLAGWNNRYDEAIKNYQEIIKIDPKNVDAYISLATQLSWKGDVKKALEVFKRAESIAPKNIDVLYALGENYDWTGKTYEATLQFKKIISLNEKEIDAYKKLAKVYLSTGQKNKAAQVLDEASRIINIYPELSAFSLEITDEMDADRLATIEEYKNAIARNPDDLETRKNLIDSYIWNKMYDNANIEYNNLLNLKVVSAIENADEKISNLAIEEIKFKLAEPVIDDMQNKIQKLNDVYKDAESDIAKGKPVRKELTDSKVKNDSLTIKDYLKKIDMLEESISRFNDIISYYDKDIQSYLTQRNALKWNLNSKRLLEQASLSEKNSINDYRPKKVSGTIEFISNNNSTASAKMSFVYNKAAAKSFPAYPLSLAGDGKVREAESIINNYIKKNTLKKQFNNTLLKLQNFIKDLEAKPLPQGVAGGKETLIKEISSLSSEAVKRLEELGKEEIEKLKSAHTIIRYIYEKALLDMETDNVPIYNEIANYHLNQEDSRVLDYYYRILEVQPLNVEVNYQLGAQNEFLGYWKSAMSNYEICINNQPDNQLARKSHYDLQKEHSLSVKDDFSFFEDKYDKEKISTRIDNKLSVEYPMNNWLSLNAGYGYRSLKDKGGASEGGVIYYPADGSVMRHSGIAGCTFSIVPWRTKLYLDFSGHMYKGEVDFEDVNNDGGDRAFDSDISYTSFNYSGKIDFPQFIKGLQLRFAYAFQDEAEQTQSLKLKFRDAVTAQTMTGSMDITFADFKFPLSDRIFLYDTIEYSKLSDSNTKTSSYNELTFRVLRFPEKGIELDLNAVGTYEASKFVAYENEAITNLPYYAPDTITSFGGGLKFRHKINNVLNGRFSYELAFQYTRDSVKYLNYSFSQTGYSPRIKLTHEWDKTNYYASFNYSTSKASSSGAKPYESQTIEFGIQHKFFTVYSPKGLGGANIAFANASPNIITADGDGKDDFTIFSLTAFDETGIKTWELEILDSNEKKVKSFSGTGNPPSTIKWDGTDKAYDPLPQSVYFYRLVIINTAGEKKISKNERIFLSMKTRAISPELSSPVFSPNDDGTKDKINIEFKATDKDKVAGWNLFVMEKKKPKKDKKKKQQRKVFRVINGFDFLPYDIEWDGRDNQGKVLPDGEYYISVKVKYEDRQEITSPEIPVQIITKATVRIKSSTAGIIPRKGMARFKPDSSSKELVSWKLSFYSPDNTLVKMINGSGKLPETIVWNGTDENDNVAGYNMPVTAVMEIQDKAGNKGVSNKETLWLEFLKEKRKDFTLITVFDQGLMHKRKDENLSNTGKEIVKRLIDELKQYRSSKKIRVVAHTSSEGSGQKNVDLSKSRARILGQIIKSGLKLATGVVNINGMGETTPYEKLNNRKWDTRYEIEIY